MAELRNRKKQQTHDALSEAAIALFLERGFDQVSVADIAAAANVSKPTLFKYFATKQDLVLHRIADHAHESARLVREAAARAATAGGKAGVPSAVPQGGGPEGVGPGSSGAEGVSRGSSGAEGVGLGGSGAKGVGLGSRGAEGVGSRSLGLVGVGSASVGESGGKVAWAARVLRDAFLVGLEQRDPVTGLNDHPEVLRYYRLVFETPALEVRVQQFIAEDQAALADALGNGLNAEVGAAQLIATQQVLSRRNHRAMVGGISADKMYATARAEAITAYATFQGVGTKTRP